MRHSSPALAFIGVLLCLVLVAAGCSSAKKFTYVNASSADGNFTLARPSSWSDQSAAGKMQYGDGQADESADGSTTGASGCTLFASSVKNFLAGGSYGSMEGYMTSLQSAWKQQASGRIESTGPTTLAGVDALQSVAYVTVKGVESKTWQVIAPAPNGDFVRVAFTCPLATYDANVPAMQQALESFTFG